jgi:hypothetical protein
MMDICRSFMRLAHLVTELMKQADDEKLLKFLFGVLLNLSGHSASKYAMDSILKDISTSEYKEMKETSTSFIDKTDTDLHFTNESYTLRTHEELRFWVDAFKALYPTRTLANSSNRQFFLPGDAEDTQGCEEWLSLVQTTLRSLKDRKPNVFGGVPPSLNAMETITVYGPYLRNSWMLIHGANTNLALLDSIIKTPYFRDFSYDAGKSIYPDRKSEDETLIGHVIAQQSSFYLAGPLYDLIAPPKEKRGGYNADLKSKAVALYTAERLKYELSFTALVGLTRSNMQALEKLVQASRRFQRYPALVWPVNYTKRIGDNDEQTSNIVLFKKVKSTKHKSNPGIDDTTLLAGLAYKESAKANAAIDKITRLLVTPPDGEEAPKPRPGAAAGGGGPDNV